MKKFKIFILILIIILTTLLIYRLNDKSVSKSNSKKITNISLVDLNYLKKEENKIYDFYGIEAITTELFKVRNNLKNGTSYSLIDKNQKILTNNFGEKHQSINNILISYSYDTPNIIFDLNGKKLTETKEKIIILSNNLLFIGDDFDKYGKLFNIKTHQYSDNYTIIQYVNDDIIYVKDNNNNYHIINSNYKILHNFKNNPQYIILSSNYLFDKDHNKLINYINNKEYKIEFDEYYPLYNNLVEVCQKDKCGVLNIKTNKIIVPLEYNDSFASLEYNSLLTYYSNDFSYNRKFNYFNDLILIDKEALYSSNGQKIKDLTDESYISIINNKQNILIEEYYGENENSTKKFFVYDNKGQLMFEDTLYYDFFDEYSLFNGYLSYNKAKNTEEKNKYGLVNQTGKTIIDFKYQDIDVYSLVYILSQNNKKAIYNYNNQEILPWGNYEIEYQTMNNNTEILLVYNNENQNLKMLLMKN